MNDKGYYFLLGMVTATLITMVVSCSFTPLEASATELGSSPYNPIYVKIVD